MMTMIRGLALVVSVLTATTVLAADQGPAGRWWRDPQVVKQIKLTQGEINRLEKAFEASRLKMIKLKSRVETEQFKLQNMVEKQNIDDKAISDQHKKLDTARSALADERFAFFVQVRKIIGHQRFQQLSAMKP